MANATMFARVERAARSPSPSDSATGGTLGQAKLFEQRPDEEWVL
jgi:hypothetical protein